MTTYQAHSQDLTPRQNQVLRFITDFTGAHGFPPSQREIAGHLKVSGTLPVMKHLAALERKGYIKREQANRGIRLSSQPTPSVALPIVGTVRAGQLTPAIEDIQGHFAVDPMAVRGDGCFFLRVKGDSMIEAGIFDGDLVMVRPQRTAENSDTVVAMLGDEVTLKWFYREKSQIRLQPANATMQPIIIRPQDGDFSLIGKVIGVYRTL